MLQKFNQKVSGKRLWSKEEDESLQKIVAQEGDNLQWAMISQKFNAHMAEVGRAVKRTNKQCRERWQNHLNPLLSNNAEWSAEEHHMLFTLLRQHSQQWCQISTKLRESGFGCRSDNHIKNYFYSSIKKAIKRINELLKDRNRLIKKQKSIMLNYNEKYAYQRHLSLQRQVQIASHLQCESSTNANNPVETESKAALGGDMKIIKELDQEIVRKILLIAESKGAKKFTISYKKYQLDAINTRNRLIDFIQNDRDFEPDDIIGLAIQILELSKKCKRKSKKNESLDESFSYGEQQKRSSDHQILPEENKIQQKDSKIDQNQKNIVEFKDHNLLDKFICQEPIMRHLSSHKFPKFSDDGTHLKQKDEQLDLLCNPAKNLSLEHSNPYLFGDDYGYIPQESDMIIDGCIQHSQNLSLLEQSQSIIEFNQAYELPLDLLKVENFVKFHRNSAQFDFINSIKEINPSKIEEHERLFDLDMNDEEYMANPFLNSAVNRKNSAFCRQNNSFSGQFDVGEAPSYIPPRNDGHPIEAKENCASEGMKLLRSPSVLCNSWAYSSSLLECVRLADLTDCMLKSKASSPL